MSVKTHEIIELRCPLGPRQLLGKVVKSGEGGRRTDDNLLELACRDCAKRLRQDDTSVRRVLHRFNVLGELVESEVERGG